MLGPVVCDISGVSLTEAEARRLAHPAVGMVILFTRNYVCPEQLSELCAQIHAVKPGLLISVDHEGGRVQRFREGFTPIPAMRAYGRMHETDPEAAARAATAAGFVLAAELLACGVDFSFAPVLDLDWGKSQIIGERSFALDPRTVTRLARALMLGMRTAGMANCGKHFPGHGWAEADSHVALPVDGRPAATIATADAKPYSWLGLGLASIMTAHVVYPDMDDKPATFSPRILQGLLRGQLNYAGFVFSDDLHMAAAQTAGSLLARARAALAAGCDGLICCNDPEAVDAMLTDFHFEPDAAWQARARRLAPAGAIGTRAQLERNPIYRKALEQMQVPQNAL